MNTKQLPNQLYDSFHMNTSSPILSKLNLTIGFLLCLANFIFFIGLPLLTNNPTYLLLWALITALLTHPYWSLIHEAIHRVFHPQQKTNDRCARVMTIFFGTIFPIVQFGHLMHHRMNRQGPDLIDAYDPLKESYWRKNLTYYLHIFGGLYLAELISPLLVFLPLPTLKKLAKKGLGADTAYYQIAEHKLLKTKPLRLMRRDAIGLYLLLITALLLYGQHGWVLIIGLLLRGFIISFSDNLPHYGTPLDKPRYAYNTRLPSLLRYYWFNFNLHRLHHENPTLPWNALYPLFTTSQDYYDISYFKQALRQLKGVWATHPSRSVK